MRFFLVFIFIHSLHRSYAANAPVISINRDDHVATVYMDYDPTAGYGEALWELGLTGTDPSGYLLEWWIDETDLDQVVPTIGCSTDKTLGTTFIGTENNPYQAISTNPVYQIQPLANGITYHLRVVKINGFGAICSPAATLTFEGGDGSRVQQLRSDMTFFDDFNLPEGLADEIKWNNAMTPQTDPRFNLFFINPQCHVHTLTGTLNGAAGDKAQVSQRARKPLLIEQVTERRIVWDMDGVFSPRGVWYLDLLPVNSDLTGHMSFFDQDGETGLPADVIRIKSKNNSLFVHLINNQGALYNLTEINLTDFGQRLSINVRSEFELFISAERVRILVNGIEVINTPIPAGNVKPGTYHALWSCIGYNTSKDDNPYFLSHWDNFGFDGPDLSPFEVHNYVSRLIGTDLQKANRYNGQEPTFTVTVPDDIRPLEAGVKNDVYLVFSYLKNDYSTFRIEGGDYFLVNGESFPLPAGGNNSNPLVPELVDYSGSEITNRIKIGEAELGNISPLLIGDNQIQFFAENTGIVNLHIEVFCPDASSMPPYTPPSDIHPFHLHGDLPKLGTPAEFVSMDGEDITQDEDRNLSGPTLSGIVDLEILVGNKAYAGWAPHLTMQPAFTPEFWSVGKTQGFENIKIFARSTANNDSSLFLIEKINTCIDAPATQLRYAYSFDTRLLESGQYELFVQTENENGLKSHPSYSGLAYKWDANEISGAYWPVTIEIDNPVVPEFIFNGPIDVEWSEGDNWNMGYQPPYGYKGRISINANCETENKAIDICKGATLELKQGATLKVASEN